MDNLRASAMLLGVLFHVAIGYIPMLENTYVLSDPNKSKVLEILALFSHLFRMPLFMLVAGFFAHYLFTKRQARSFLKNRALRVLLPLVVFMPILSIAMIAVIYQATGTVENKAPMLLFLMENFAPDSEAAPPPISTFHLWFLFNLMLFYITAMLWVRFSPFNISQWVSNASSSNTLWGLLVVVPVIVAISYYAQPIPPLSPPDKLYPQWWSFANYGSFFLLGWLFFARPNLFDKIKKYSFLFIGLSLILYAAVYHFYPSNLPIESVFSPNISAIPTGPKILLSCLQAMIGAYMSYALLLLGKKYLSSENNTMRYFSDASYWVYLSHVPVLMLFQMYLVDSHLDVWVKFTITFASTIVICTLAYQLVVRYTPIGWMLNGRKNRT
jgi:peptidoglycan/LPS O-acetylase OafA/YrhL